MVDRLHSQFDLLDVRVKNGCQDLPLADPAIRHFHALDGIQLRPDHLAKGLLESRIPFVTKGHRKPYYRRFTDAHLFSHPGRRQKRRLIIILLNEIRKLSLPFAELRIPIFYFLPQFIFAKHKIKSLFLGSFTPLLLYSLSRKHSRDFITKRDCRNSPFPFSHFLYSPPKPDNFRSPYLPQSGQPSSAVPLCT